MPPERRQDRAAQNISDRVNLRFARLAPLRVLADAAKAELCDHASGCRVVDEVAAGQTAKAAGAEAVVDHRMGGFRGEPVPPPRLADPIPDLGLAPLVLDVADGADELAVELDPAHELVV